MSLEDIRARLPAGVRDALAKHASEMQAWAGDDAQLAAYVAPLDCEACAPRFSEVLLNRELTPPAPFLARLVFVHALEDVPPALRAAAPRVVLKGGKEVLGLGLSSRLSVLASGLATCGLVGRSGWSDRGTKTWGSSWSDLHTVIWKRAFRPELGTFAECEGRHDLDLFAWCKDCTRIPFPTARDSAAKWLVAQQTHYHRLVCENGGEWPIGAHFLAPKRPVTPAPPASRSPELAAQSAPRTRIVENPHRVPAEVLALVVGAPPMHLAVLADLYRLGALERRPDDGTPQMIVRPSVAGLAKRCHCCERTVERGLARFRNQCIVRPLVRGRRFNGSSFVSAYELPRSAAHVRAWRAMRRKEGGRWWATARTFYARKGNRARGGSK